jgi:DnaJ-class molecular chaperone
MILTLGALVVLVVVGYRASLHLHPFRPCRWCNSTGKHRGSIYTFAHRPCGHCSGSGRRPRFGTRFVGKL